MTEPASSQNSPRNDSLKSNENI